MKQNWCECSACGRVFGGLKGFEMHRVGPMRDRSCLDPAGMPERYKEHGGVWFRYFGGKNDSSGV